MTDERTEYQTAGGQSASQKLSMQATTPPAEVPGYRLTRFLGAGAFGQVWVGRDLNTGRNVAVKFYLHRGGVNWSLLSREVKNLVQLSADRYVVQVLEVGWDADPPYYVMEYIEGGSLEDLLQARDRLPVGEAVQMFRKLCIGLNRCHDRGVLHCDIKPANILLDDDNEPRLADFGQSRLSNEQTPALGTLFYMAPEQADLKSTPDASWDVYAVGAIMYRMLTGQPPHRDDSVVVQIDTAGSLEKRLERYRTAIASSPPPEVHTRRTGVDRFLGRIISKCLAVDPQDRYANVQQILQDLHRRDQNRARRPLTLLGIVGPLLILIATCVFGARSIHRASTSTKIALRAEALESNKLAAAFAARTLENEIQRYFQVSRDEASRPEFVEQLRIALETPEVDSALQEIASLGAPALTHRKTEVRERLLDVPARLQLEAILNQRLKRYPVNNKQSRRPRLASMFVTDSKGTILSIAFEQEVERDENSAGKNFCYRTYFHGGREDLPQAETRIGDIKPLTTTRLSAAFPSTATRLWKVAISTPVYLTDDRKEPDAIFVVTINLGDFELPQSEQSANKIAVLVEAREGPEQGTILQHPLMDLRRSDDTKLEGERYQMSTEMLQRLLKGGDVNYVDPLAAAPDGQPYVGPWIAAMQPISVPNIENDELAMATSTEQDRADLLILVQYRLETVFEPVNQMQEDLLWEGAAAIASILLVTLALWFFVRKVGNPLTEQTPTSAVSKPSSQGTTETIAV